MRIRSPYPSGWGRTVTVITAVAALTLTGCQATGEGQAGTPADTTSPSTAGTSPSTDTGQPTQSPSATASATAPLPDVCALLSRSEVRTLTGGKSILSIDPDPGPNSPVRHCQWQLSGARLAIQISPTTEATFRQDHPTEARVPGLGDDSYFLSNHLLIRKQTIQIDVYASTAEGRTNDQRLAKAAAAMVVTRL